jgi:hypothetical protein
MIMDFGDVRLYASTLCHSAGSARRKEEPLSFESISFTDEAFQLIHPLPWLQPLRLQ